MKYVTYEVKTTIGNKNRLGVLIDNMVIDLHAAYAMYLREVRGLYRWKELAESIIPPDMLLFIENGDMAVEAANLALEYIKTTGKAILKLNDEKITYDINEVKLRAPVLRPLSIRDCSAFLQHILNAERQMAASQGRDPNIVKLPEVYYRIPAHYRTSTTDVIGTGDPILWPSYSKQLDYELEFAVCIGKKGINIPVEKAHEYIFGYTLFNDITARDRQREEIPLRMGPAKGKCFQNSNIMGPCLATTDEIDAGNLKLRAKVNGEIWSQGTSSDMNFSFPMLINYLSQDEYVYPGEFICSGTVGFGAGHESEKWLKPGDIIELEADGIGIIRNKVEKHQ